MGNVNGGTASVIRTVRRSCSRKMASRFVGPVIGTNMSNAVGRNSIIVFFGCHGSHTGRLAMILARRSVPRTNVRAVPKLRCCYVAPCSTSFGNIRVLFSGRGITGALNRCLTTGKGGRLRVTRARGCTRMAFFFGNNHRAPCSGRSHVLIPSPGITACSLGPRVDTCRIGSGLITTVGRGGCSFVIIGCTGNSVMNRANVCRTVRGTMITMSTYIGSAVRTTGTRNCRTVVVTSRNGTSRTLGRSNAPGATRSLGPMPYMCIARGGRTGITSKHLTSITPAVLRVLSVIRPTRVANYGLVGWLVTFCCGDCRRGVGYFQRTCAS